MASTAWQALAAVTLFAVAATCFDPPEGPDHIPWPYERNYLRPGDTLAAGSELRSATAKVVVQSGAALVIRHRDGAQLWSTNTTGSTADTLKMLSDGNLQLLNAATGTVVWKTAIVNASKIAVLQDDCNFVMYETPPLTAPMWASNSQKCIKAHIVPHSHDDVGWLITPEDYYDGCRSGPEDGVNGILDHVVEALSLNPMRTFSEVEMYYFHRWWERKNETVRNLARALVKNGQLEIINAGWSMHDEACVHQESAIWNMAIGAQFIQKEFGDSAKIAIGWHIDPFGHASTTPRIMSQYGFNAFFFQRQDYEQRRYMMDTKTVETIWAPSPSLGTETLMFTSIMFDGYCSGCGPEFELCPNGFCCFTCEQSPFDGNTSPFQDFYSELTDRAAMWRRRESHRKVKEHDPTYLKYVAESYAGYILNYAGKFRTQNVLIPWGCDFQHMHALDDYNLMDKVIELINNNASYGIEMLYSSPTHYMRDVHAANYSWPVNRYDYFLDSDNAHSYWSGYLSSRPAYKGYERKIMNELGAVDALLAMRSPFRTLSQNSRSIDQVYYLRKALGIAQHHDSITGTERVHVRNKYQWIIHNSTVQSDAAMASLFREQAGVDVGACHLANNSMCPHTDPLLAGQSVGVFVFNSLMWNRTERLVIPVPTKNVVPRIAHGAAGKGQVIGYQIDSAWDIEETNDESSPVFPRQPYRLTVKLFVAPLAWVQVVLTPQPTSNFATEKKVSADRNYIENEFYKLSFDTTTGRVTQLTYRKNDYQELSATLDHNILYYCPHNNSNGEQADGAYIMRPCTPNPDPTPFAKVFTASVVTGALCQELRLRVDSASNIQQVFRLCKGDAFVDVVTGVGTIDPGTKGKEVIMRVGTDLSTDKTWYTDSQGLEVQKRVRHSRPNYPFTVTEPIASNYFPANVFAFVNESTGQNRRSVAVIADRSRSTSSMHDGELEFLIHRRLLFDDGRGVAQALNESTRIITTSRMVLVPAETTMRVVRPNGVLHAHPLVPRFGPVSAIPSSSVDLPPFPPQVHLHTFAMIATDTMIVRLEHIYAVGEDAEYSVDVAINLEAFLTSVGIRIASFVETDLNGVQEWKDVNRLAFRTYGNLQYSKRAAQTNLRAVKLRPMDILTFRLKIRNF